MVDAAGLGGLVTARDFYAASGRLLCPAAVAAPAPFRRMLHPLRHHGVHEDVVEHAAERLAVFNEHRLVAALQHVADALVPTVEPLAVAGIELLHHAGDRQGVWLQQQMHVVPKQAVPQTSHAEPADAALKEFDVARVIAVVEKDGLLGVAARHHVINHSRDMQTQRTGHTDAGGNPCAKRPFHESCLICAGPGEGSGEKATPRASADCRSWLGVPR